MSDFSDIFVDAITIVFNIPNIRSNIEIMYGRGCVEEIMAIVRAQSTRSASATASATSTAAQLQDVVNWDLDDVIEPEPVQAPIRKKPKKKSKAPEADQAPEAEVEQAQTKKRTRKPKVKEPEPELEADQTLDLDNLDKMTIVMLKAKCKEMNIKPAGNKQALINKIREQMTANNVPVDPETPDQSDDEEDPGEGPSNADDIKIVQDDDNLYIHKESGLIFDPNFKVVVAWKDQDGNVLPLTAEHAELCQQYGFEYRLEDE